MTQQEFLQHAMTQLGLTSELFAKRIGISESGLEALMLVPDDEGYREMPESMWKFVREITIRQPS